MASDYINRVQKPDQTVNPLFASLGIEIVNISPEQTIFKLPVKPGFMQGAGVVAGGILSTLMDEAMAHAALSTLENGQTTATMDLSCRYFKPVGAGDVLTASAVVVKKGRRIIFTEAQVVDNRDRLTARASATFIIG